MADADADSDMRFRSCDIVDTAADDCRRISIAAGCADGGGRGRPIPDLAGCDDSDAATGCGRFEFDRRAGSMAASVWRRRIVDIFRIYPVECFDLVFGTVEQDDDRQEGAGVITILKCQDRFEIPAERLLSVGQLHFDRDIVEMQSGRADRIDGLDA